MKLPTVVQGTTGTVVMTVGRTVYDVLLDWNVRTADWRATITRRSDGRTIASHARVSPQAPLVTFPGVGAIYAFGESPYTVDAFNTGALTLEWLTQVELDIIFADEAAVTPTWRLV